MINELIPVNAFQTAVPSEDGLLTVRTLNTESISNNDLLNTYELLTVEDIPEMLYTQGTCFSELENLTLIVTKEELFIYLCEVLIRFDADPDHYQKSDYEALIRLLVRTLIHLYENEATPDGFLSFAPVLGIALTTTDPLDIMLQNNHRYPALFMAESVGVYTNFGITVTEEDLVNSVVWLIPTIVDSEFTSYRKEVYTMTMDAMAQLQSDWNQTDIDAPDYIKNKPVIYIDTTRTQLKTGSVIWLHDLVFRVTPCTYYILGQYYTSPQTDITLTPSDVTNSRIDALWVDVNGVAGFSTGTPSTDPAKPIVDASTQLELTSVLIPANATTPSGVTNTIVYDENVEWTFTNLVGVDVTFDLNNLEDPYTGTKALKISPTVLSSLDLNAMFKFTGPNTNFVGGNLIFHIKTTGLDPTSEFTIRVSDGVNSAYTLILQSNPFGLSYSDINWQQVIISSSVFNIGISPISSVEIKFGVTSLISNEIFFDKIYIQSGLIVGTTYEHPSYIPVNLTATGANVITSLVTDSIGSVISATVRTLTLSDFGFAIPTSNVLEWTDGKYQPYAAKKAADPGYGYFYVGSTIPTFVNRLNLDGVLFASQVKATNATLAAFIGESTSGAGIQAQSYSYFGGSLLSQTNAALLATVIPNSTNIAHDNIVMQRRTNGTAADGIGQSIRFETQIANGTTPTTGYFKHIVTDTSATPTSTFEWWLQQSGSREKRMELFPTGLNIISPVENLAITTAELNSSPDSWSITGDVTASGGGVYTFGSPGTARTISYDFGTVTIGDTYVLIFGITGAMPGSDRFPTVTFAGVSRVESAYAIVGYWHYDITPTTTSGLLTFSIPTANTLTTYSIHSISLKRVTAPSNAVLTTAIIDDISAQFRSSVTNNNLSIGVNAGNYLISTSELIDGGIHNLAFGNEALSRATISNYCVAIGNFSQYSNAEGDYNISMGYGSLYTNKIGYSSVAIGHNAAYTATGRGTTAIGYRAVRSLTTSDFTTAVGYLAGQSLTTGTYNTIFGANTLGAATSVNQTVAIGAYTLNGSASGSGLVGVGFNVLSTHTSGNYITAIGAYAAPLVNGTSSTFVGAWAGGGQSGNSSFEIVQYYGNLTDDKATIIGMNAGKNAMTNVNFSNFIAIGYDTKVYQSNQIVFGNNSIASTYLKGVVEVRDFNILNTEVLADPNFPAASTKWDVTGDFALSAAGMTFTNSSGSGTFTQTLAKQAFPSKKRRWYKFTYSTSGNLAVPGPGLSTFVLTMTGSTFAPVTLNLVGGNTSSYAYIYSIDTPTDISFSMTCSIGTGNGILNFTAMSLKECIGGDLFVNRNIEQTRGGFQYHSQYIGMDTIGDWRSYATYKGFYTEYCTVGNATKGAGTWVAKQIITI